jgi:hypothetical protein
MPACPCDILRVVDGWAAIEKTVGRIPALAALARFTVVLNLNPAIWEAIAATGWHLGWSLESERE